MEQYRVVGMTDREVYGEGATLGDATLAAALRQERDGGAGGGYVVVPPGDEIADVLGRVKADLDAMNN